jgi:isoleucyl-tRNA synthetase
MPMIGIYPVLGFGESHCLWRTEDKQGSFNRFDRRVIQRNRKVNSGRIPKENPFKGFEIGNMDEANYDLVDLHKT